MRLLKRLKIHLPNQPVVYKMEKKARKTKIKLPEGLKKDFKRRLTKAMKEDNGECLSFAVEMGEIIKEVGVSAIARATGLNRTGLYASFGETKTEPRFSSVVKICRALGIRFSVR